MMWLTSRPHNPVATSAAAQRAARFKYPRGPANGRRP